MYGSLGGFKLEDNVHHRCDVYQIVSLGYVHFFPQNFTLKNACV